jgi:hypothetical protein
MPAFILLFSSFLFSFLPGSCKCLFCILHCKEPKPKIRNKYILPEKELHGHSPNFHNHMSVSDLYIPTMGLPILPQENMKTDPGNINRSQTHECANWDRGWAIPFHIWYFPCSAPFILSAYFCSLYSLKAASVSSVSYTAKNKYRKFEINIPRKGIVRPQSQFPQSCEQFIYSVPKIGLPILPQENM